MCDLCPADRLVQWLVLIRALLAALATGANLGMQALLLAYYFHMYMAIFAGGYLIKKMVGRAFGLDSASGDGVQTFVLADGVNPGTFRKEYKEAINVIKTATCPPPNALQGLTLFSLHIGC